MSLVRGRQVRDEADARACLAAAEGASTLNAWCRSHGVSAGSLHAWRRRLAGATVRLVELTLPPAPSARYEVVVGDVRVVVGDDFHDDTLARLLQVVRAC